MALECADATCARRRSMGVRRPHASSSPATSTPTRAAASVTSGWRSFLGRVTATSTRLCAMRAPTPHHTTPRTRKARPAAVSALPVVRASIKARSRRAATGARCPWRPRAPSPPSATAEVGRVRRRILRGQRVAVYPCPHQQTTLPPGSLAQRLRLPSRSRVPGRRDECDACPAHLACNGTNAAARPVGPPNSGGPVTSRETTCAAAPTGRPAQAARRPTPCTIAARTRRVRRVAA